MSFQKKIRFLFLLLSAIVKKHFRGILVGIFLGTVFYFLVPLVFVYIPKPNPVLKIGKVGQFTINEIPEEILNEISLGLTFVAENSDVLPSVAESWSAEDEGKSFRFKLGPRPLYWHDGKRFSPFDINYNFKDVVASSEDNEIIFRLKEPFSPFPSVVSKPLFKQGLVGIGTYKVKKIEKSGKYVKSIQLVSDFNKSLPVKWYKFYPSERELKTAFNLGEVNFLENLFDKEGILAGKSVEFKESLRRDVYIALFFNTSKELFQQKSFRQALSYAIPKEAGEKRALTPLNPLSWAYNKDVKPYSQDEERAKSLIEKELPSLKNTSIVISTLPQYEKIASLIVESWGKLGIQSRVEIFSFLPADYDALLVAREIPREPDQYYFWHSTQAGNLAHFKNPRVDKLLEDGRKTLDNEERKNIYFDFQRFLVEESPAVFLSHPTTFTVYRNSVFKSLFSQ